MKVLQFLVVEENINNGRNVHAVTGECYIPCESLVPVIRKGKGCVGVAVVKGLHITHESTQIEFELSREISKEKKTAYYDLYRNHVSVSGSSSDPYEDTDQIIPGAMVGNSRAVKEPRERGLSDMLSDYDNYRL